MMIWWLWFFFILANLGWSVDHLGWNHQEVVTISGNPNSACFRCLCRRHFMDCERSSTAFPSCFCPLNISSWWWKKCLPKPGKSQLVHSKLLQDRAIFWMWSQVPGGNGKWPLTDSWEAPPFLSIAAGEFRAADPDPDGEMKVKLEEIDGEGGKWCRDLGRVTWDHMGSPNKRKVHHDSSQRQERWCFSGFVFQIFMLHRWCMSHDPALCERIWQKLESNRDSVRRTLLLFSLRIGWYVVQS